MCNTTILFICTAFIYTIVAIALPRQPPQKGSAPKLNDSLEVKPPENEYYGPPGSYDPDYKHDDRYGSPTLEEEPIHGLAQHLRRYIYIVTEYLRPVIKCVSPLVPPLVINLN